MNAKEMETVITAILALNGTLVGALIWVVRSILGALSAEIRENTKALHDLRDAVEILASKQ